MYLTDKDERAEAAVTMDLDSDTKKGNRASNIKDLMNKMTLISPIPKQNLPQKKVIIEKLKVNIIIIV